MPNITIPKEIAGSKELVAVPRTLYEEFLAWQKKVKSAETFTPTAAEKRDLKRARADYKKGNYMTLDELKRRLDIKG